MLVSIVLIIHQGGYPPIRSLGSQRFRHFSGEMLHREGLLDQVSTLLQNSPVVNGILCISGHEQVPDTRTKGLDKFLQLLVIYCWLHNAGEKKGDLGTAMVADPEPDI